MLRCLPVLAIARVGLAVIAIELLVVAVIAVSASATPVSGFPGSLIPSASLRFVEQGQAMPAGAESSGSIFLPLIANGQPGPNAPPVALAAGGYHTCGLGADGGVRCWGGNWAGQLGDGTRDGHLVPQQVSGLTQGVLAITAGYEHTCALLTGGAVKCWGGNDEGQLGNGSTTGSTTPVAVSGLAKDVSAISAGEYHTCALVKGAVKCWGLNDDGQVGDGTRVRRLTPVGVSGVGAVSVISAGAYHTCALSGSAYCWGDNTWYQLGDNLGTSRPTPSIVPTLADDVVDLDAGNRHSCAIMAYGGVKCWGHNADGNLGNGTTGVSWPYNPVDVVGLGSTVADIAAGDRHSCVILDTGALQCWGNNWYGQLADGTAANRSAPTTVDGVIDVSQVSTGSWHTCALTGGVAMCWGMNSHGQLGNGMRTMGHPAPTDVIGSNSFAAIAAGYSHTCARTTDGSVKCWGRNSWGEVGDDSIYIRGRPVDVVGLSSGATTLGLGWGHSCASRTVGPSQCWGFGGWGQLGTSGVGDAHTPANVYMLGSVAQIGGGWAHTCALVQSGGPVKCWGANHHGQLGIGTTETKLTPTDVTGVGAGVTSVAVGFEHACAIDSGAVRCWGRNDAGQVGDGTNQDRLVPVNVLGVSGITALAAGANHTCALTGGGGVTCWGANDHGQLGDGTTTNSSTPRNVTGLSGGVKAIAAGGRHSCALLTDGTIQCWGSNGDGQLGEGSFDRSLAPVAVVGLSGTATAIAAGDWYTCALAGGVAQCWGDNSYGQLGIGVIDGYFAPVAVLW